MCTHTHWECQHPDACRGQADVSFEARCFYSCVGVLNLGPGLARDEEMVAVKGKGVGVFSFPARSGAPISTQCSERQCAFTERRQRVLDNKNRPLNTVITIRLRSLPHFQFITRWLFAFFFSGPRGVLPGRVIRFGQLFGVSDRMLSWSPQWK